ncbi:helix-turn-helix transcriptional regulator [Devosia sediminis]|uniref:Helix-turn-helix transcriptional regulator n=1 Tax=Devosia sediminis TaxID=2798801 RepID=A0A934MPN3_9HYPH|nr:AraC family transcriptional regulator [Devosia sediminis]MBJ3783499.1 helix-turn-helix transcriptional regulator [Devosia sediminis]
MSRGTRGSWAFASNKAGATEVFDQDGRIAVEKAGLSVRMDHAVIREGVSLFSGGGISPHGYSVSPLGDMPSSNLVLGCMVGGSGVIHAEGNDSQRWRLPGQMYAVSLSERKLSYDIDGNADYQSVALMLTPDALEAMGSQDGLPRVVDAVLNGRADPMLLMRAMAPGAVRVAQELMTPIYQGAMLHLYQEGKALELLAMQLDMLAGEMPDADQLSARELMRVREARERLLANLREPESLTALAGAVGLSTRRLNLGFRLLFGTTVFDYLLEARMAAARRMLDEGAEMSLKQLAWTVGYNQVSNFSTAFRRRFGVSPGVYRREHVED